MKKLQTQHQKVGRIVSTRENQELNSSQNILEFSDFNNKQESQSSVQSRNLQQNNNLQKQNRTKKQARQNSNDFQNQQNTVNHENSFGPTDSSKEKLELQIDKSLQCYSQSEQTDTFSEFKKMSLTNQSETFQKIQKNFQEKAQTQSQIIQQLEASNQYFRTLDSEAFEKQRYYASSNNQSFRKFQEDKDLNVENKELIEQNKKLQAEIDQLIQAEKEIIKSIALQSKKALLFENEEDQKLWESIGQGLNEVKQDLSDHQTMVKSMQIPIKPTEHFQQPRIQQIPKNMSRRPLSVKASPKRQVYSISRQSSVSRICSPEPEFNSSIIKPDIKQKQGNNLAQLGTLKLQNEIEQLRLRKILQNRNSFY